MSAGFRRARGGSTRAAGTTARADACWSSCAVSVATNERALIRKLDICRSSRNRADGVARRNKPVGMRLGRRELALQCPAAKIAGYRLSARQGLVHDEESLARRDRLERLRLVEANGNRSRPSSVADVDKVADAVEVNDKDPERSVVPTVFGAHVCLRPPLIAHLKRILIAHHRRSARMLGEIEAELAQESAEQRLQREAEASTPSYASVRASVTDALLDNASKRALNFTR